MRCRCRRRASEPPRLSPLLVRSHLGLLRAVLCPGKGEQRLKTPREEDSVRMLGLEIGRLPRRGQYLVLTAVFFFFTLLYGCVSASAPAPAPFCFRAAHPLTRAPAHRPPPPRPARPDTCRSSSS